MSSWLGLDDEIYCRLQDMGGLTNVDSGPYSDIWPEIIRQHVTAPTAVLARHLASPNYEMLWFSRFARRNGMRTLVIEHGTDIFTVNNPAKVALVALPIVTGRDSHGRLIVRREKLAKPDVAEGRRLVDVQTQTGERLRDYHHRKLVEVLGDDRPDILDLRDVFSSTSLRPSVYYPEFFKMLTGPLVLFEDFVTDDRTANFFRSTVLPAWRRAVSETARRPQIARLSPEGRASSPIWSAYPVTAAEGSIWSRQRRPVDLRELSARGLSAAPRSRRR